jgi:hypothetical protein
MGPNQSKAHKGQPTNTPPVKGVLRTLPMSDALVNHNNKPGGRVGGQHHQSQGGGGGASATPTTTNQQQQQQAKEETPLFPVVLRYKNSKGGDGTKGVSPPPGDVHSSSTKPHVSVLCEHYSWKPIDMSPSGEDFFALVLLPKGDQAFKFLINGEEKLDISQPQRSDGIHSNFVHVSQALMSTKEEDDALEENVGWGQEQVVFEETRKFPPILPPHLRYTPLNTPSSQYRALQQLQQQQQNTTAPGTGEVAELDPEHLPLPLSVTINHVYFQRRDDHTVLGLTTRYRNKFSTVVYYKGKTSPLVTG